MHTKSIKRGRKCNRCNNFRRDQIISWQLHRSPGKSIHQLLDNLLLCIGFGLQLSWQLVIFAGVDGQYHSQAKSAYVVYFYSSISSKSPSQSLLMRYFIVGTRKRKTQLYKGTSTISFLATFAIWICLVDSIFDMIPGMVSLLHCGI